MKQTPDWDEEPVSKGHKREDFDCGDPRLNEYLCRHARKSHEHGGAKTFLAVSKEDHKTILGFYSLSPASMAYDRTPERIRSRLARHDVPLFRLARLAVDFRVQNKGIGGQLLLAAGRRCLLAATEVGGVALLIDAKNDRVARWYESCGALPILDAPLSLLLPLSILKAALQAAGKLA